MAINDSIRAALENVDNIALELDTFANTSYDLTAERPGAPNWPFLVMCHTRRLETALDALRKELQ